MLFHSLPFILFIFLFSMLWKLSWSKQSRWILLSLSSLVFYAPNGFHHLALLLIIGLIHYSIVFLNYKIAATFNVIFSIAVLFFYKYFDLFIMGQGTSISFLQENPSQLKILPPIGLSFYLFQAISYSVDVATKRLTPTKNVFHFFSYMAMFPQLVAGPICRGNGILQQLDRPIKIDEHQKFEALKLVVFGLVKKVLLADYLNMWTSSAFQSSFVTENAAYWILMTLAFSWQIYFDFSGYTDIARGLGKFMGIELPMNFNFPYLATTLQNFWQRWHMSLSLWFRDYVYIPLGGSRYGKLRLIFAIMATFLLSGLWHGANWTFLLWGFYHGLLLIIEKLFFKGKFKARYDFVYRYFVLFSIFLGWIIFRSPNLIQLKKILLALLGFNFTIDLSAHFGLITLIGCSFFFEYFFWRKTQKPTNKANFLDWASIGIFIPMIIFLGAKAEKFIYFKF